MDSLWYELFQYNDTCYNTFKDHSVGNPVLLFHGASVQLAVERPKLHYEWSKQAHNKADLRYFCLKSQSTEIVC